MMLPFLALLLATAAAAEKPNILFILADDLGYVDLYNLQDDLGENKNLATKHPDLVAKLTAKMDAARVPSKSFPFPALDRISQP